MFPNEEARKMFLQDSTRKVFKKDLVQPYLQEENGTIVVDFKSSNIPLPPVVGDNKTNSSMPGSILTFFILLIFNFFIYYNSLKNGFAFDDYLGIVNNPDVTPNVPFHDILRHDLWGKHLLKIDSHRSFRPLLTILFKLFCHTFGIEPFPLRVFSIFTHFLASFLVYILGMTLTANREVSFFSSLLFASHPVHVEAVACVINMAEPLCAVFYLCAILLYLHSASCEKTSSFVRVSTLLLWFFIVVVSCLIKETGITVVGVVYASIALSVISCFNMNEWSFRRTLSFVWHRGYFSYIFIGILVIFWYLMLRKLIVTVDIVEFLQPAFENFEALKQKLKDL
jgi:hypothetical protein